jgi:hypothetical protein
MIVTRNECVHVWAGSVAILRNHSANFALEVQKTNDHSGLQVWRKKIETQATPAGCSR